VGPGFPAEIFRLGGAVVIAESLDSQYSLADDGVDEFRLLPQIVARVGDDRDAPALADQLHGVLKPQQLQGDMGGFALGHEIPIKVEIGHVAPAAARPVGLEQRMAGAGRVGQQHLGDQLRAGNIAGGLLQHRRGVDHQPQLAQLGQNPRESLQLPGLHLLS
jgi:hypothetical protein